MRTHQLLTLTLAAGLLVSAMVPSLARPARNDHKGRVKIVTRKDRDDSDKRSYQQWHREQTRKFDQIDRETGKRIGDLLQVVSEVTKDRLMVVDSQGLRRAVFISNATQVVFPEIKIDPPNVRGSRDREDITRLVAVGDLVIVEGHLRDNGGLFATRIRVYGQSFGYADTPRREYDDRDRGRDQGCDPRDTKPTRPTYQGFRNFGEVRDVDGRSEWFKVDGNNVRTTVMLEKGAEVLLHGRCVSISALRPGDRVVYYYNGTLYPTVRASRVVVLDRNEAYPRGDDAFRGDPGYDRYDNSRDNAPYYEGRIRSVEAGPFFFKLFLRTDDGKEVSIMVSKALNVFDRNGKSCKLEDLRDTDRLRVNYLNVNGLFFAGGLTLR